MKLQSYCERRGTLSFSIFLSFFLSIVMSTILGITMEQLLTEGLEGYLGGSTHDERKKAISLIK